MVPASDVSARAPNFEASEGSLWRSRIRATPVYANLTELGVARDGATESTVGLVVQDVRAMVARWIGAKDAAEVWVRVGTDAVTEEAVVAPLRVRVRGIGRFVEEAVAVF